MVKRLCAMCRKSMEERGWRWILRSKKQRAVFTASLLAAYESDSIILKNLYISTRRIRLCHFHYVEAAQFIGAQMLLYGFIFPTVEAEVDAAASLIEGKHISAHIINRLNAYVHTFDTQLTLSGKDVAIFMRDCLRKYYTPSGWNADKKKDELLGAIAESPPEEIDWDDSENWDTSIKKEPLSGLEQQMDIKFELDQHTAEDQSTSTFAPPVVHEDTSSYEKLATMVSLSSSTKASASTEEGTEVPKTDPALLNSFFLVQGAMLMQLFMICQHCCTRLSPRKVQLTAVGTTPVVQYYCPNCCFGKTDLKRWEGQKRAVQHRSEQSFLGNVLCALAAITTGTRFNELQRWAHQMKLEFISNSFFWKWFKWCKPAIEKVYFSQQQRVFDIIRRKYADGEGLELAADGAFNSKGYTALIGKVLLVDLKTKLILHTEILHRSETNGITSLMAQEGLRRLLRWIISKGWKVKSLTTDRNRGVARMVEEMQNEIGVVEHYWDGWHLVKWFGNNVRKEMKREDCAVLKDWYEKLKTHLWYSIDAEKGRGKEIAYRFNTCLYHVQHVHEWPANNYTGHFTRCTHSENDEDTGDTLPAVKQGTPAHERLRMVVMNRTFQKDLERASPNGGALVCESKNALDRLYCRKEIYYPLSTYKLYSKLSTLHFNSLAMAEIAGERLTQRIIQVQRKYYERKSQILFKTPVEHLWRGKIIQSVLNARLQQLEGGETPDENFQQLMEMQDAEEAYDDAEEAPELTDVEDEEHGEEL